MTPTSCPIHIILKSPPSGVHARLLGVAESFCSRFPPRPFSYGRADVSYLPPDTEYSLLQLILYIFSFVTLVLIFFYIASERPGEKKKKEEEED